MSTNGQEILILFSNPIARNGMQYHLLLNFTSEKDTYIKAMAKSQTPFGCRFLCGVDYDGFLCAINAVKDNTSTQSSVLNLSSHAGLTEDGGTELLFESNKEPDNVEQITTDDIAKQICDSILKDKLNSLFPKLPNTNVKLIVLNCYQGSQLEQWLCDEMDAEHVIALDRENTTPLVELFDNPLEKPIYPIHHNAQLQEHSATTLLIHAFLNIAEYPDVDTLLQFLNKTSVEFTGCGLSKFESHRFSTAIAPFIAGTDRFTHIKPPRNGNDKWSCSQEVLDILVPIGIFFDMCSENYQQIIRKQQLQTEQSNLLLSPPQQKPQLQQLQLPQHSQSHQQLQPHQRPQSHQQQTQQPYLSFQHLRNNGQCGMISYQGLKALVATRSSLIKDNTISVCFFGLGPIDEITQRFKDHQQASGQPKDDVEIQSVFLLVKYRTQPSETRNKLLRGWDKIWCLSLMDGTFFCRSSENWLEFASVTELLHTVARNRQFLTTNSTDNNLMNENNQF